MLSDSKDKEGRFFVRKLPDGIQNLLDAGSLLRYGDQFRIRAAASDSNFPFFVLSDSGLGTFMKVSFVNGRSWDEGERSEFLQLIERGLGNESEKPLVEFTYSFQVVRRPFNSNELNGLHSQGKHPITDMRVENLQDIAGNLGVQAVDFYFSITATPSKFLQNQEIGFIDRIKSLWDKKIKYRAESTLLEDVIMQFGDKIKQVAALFANLGIGVEIPKDEAELLINARKAWRPNYIQPGAAGYDCPVVRRSLEAEGYLSPGDFLSRDLRVDQYKKHWVADGCLNMLFSMNDAPDPHRVFSAMESDRFLSLGIRKGLGNIPYFGTYTVSWSSMTRDEGDQKFKIKNTFAKGMTSDQKGMFEDKVAAKEAREIDVMHEEFTEGGGDMVRACVMFQLSIPLEHLARFFDTSVSDVETIHSLTRELLTNLNEIGQSRWELEDRTYFPTWINSMPGVLCSVDRVQYMPRLYLPLSGALHLVPFFATVGLDQKAFNGANYFITDDASLFIFDHFSKNNGPAANFSVCGATGSGKSVTVQSLVMMCEEKDPNIMILDFGGGNLGSWTKLCSAMNGTELKFGSARPPLINPFQLSESDSLPNRKKRREVAVELGLDPHDNDQLTTVDSLYLYLNSEDSPFIRPQTRVRELVKRCPQIEGITSGLEDEGVYKKVAQILRLTPGMIRPGEKGVAAIRLILELLLVQDVDENGPRTSAWSTFSLDDINEAILHLYETFIPTKTGQWPTLSDFKDAITQLHERRSSGEAEHGHEGVYNYSLLMRRLGNFCRGGLDPFLDGQTNVPITRKVVEHGVEKERAAKFILADMAGIGDPRKIALYTIVVNEFMSRVLYNSRDSRGIMIRDEAWLFMRSSIAAPYLEADYRLARKYGFSVITIAQQYSDFSSAAIQGNTQNWVICSLASSDEIDYADQRFGFSEEERRLFSGNGMGTTVERDVFTGKITDAYSRIMIANQSGKYFIKNKISRAERWVTTTDDDEVFIFNFYKDTKFYKGEVSELVDWLCREDYLGDPELKAAASQAGRKVKRI